VSLELGCSREPDGQLQVQAGCFVFVVGPSGAGKDTLINGAQRIMADDDRYHFLQRTVTRPRGEWEDHQSLPEDGFAEAEASGGFALTWAAHGLRYGVPITAKHLIRSGKIVVCNGSRAAIGDALAQFACIEIVMITAAPDVRLRRLLARGRESDVKHRMDRHADWDAHSIASVIIQNDGEPDTATFALVDFLRAVATR